MSSANQSVLNAATGSAAELLGQLGAVLYGGAAAIFLVVMALAIYSTFAKGRRIHASRWIIGGGLVFPVIVLSALLVYSLEIGNEIEEPGSAAAGQHSAPIRIEVVGRQWWWEVRYHRPGAAPAVVLANEIHVPIDRTIELILSTADVIHSFWVPALAGKVDMVPGRTTHLRLRSSEAGTFRGQCAEYCGGQHAWMALFVIVEGEEQFEAWLARQARSATVPSDPFLKLGYDAFFKGGCQECHAVRGTPATAQLGPDLTHVGSRESLAAGMLDNHVGTLAGWIAGAQDIKPGNLMPSMAVYTGTELRAVSAWLESLE